jgi:hypothetical protein
MYIYVSQYVYTCMSACMSVYTRAHTFSPQPASDAWRLSCGAAARDGRAELWRLQRPRSLCGLQFRRASQPQRCVWRVLVLVRSHLRVFNRRWATHSHTQWCTTTRTARPERPAAPTRWRRALMFHCVIVGFAVCSVFPSCCLPLLFVYCPFVLVSLMHRFVVPHWCTVSSSCCCCCFFLSLVLLSIYIRCQFKLPLYSTLWVFTVFESCLNEPTKGLSRTWGSCARGYSTSCVLINVGISHSSR